jgi:hypothetical protein
MHSSNSNQEEFNKVKIVQNTSKYKKTHHKIFKITKDKNDGGESEKNDDEEDIVSSSFNDVMEEIPKNKRVSAFSKVNFSKLSDDEKNERLRNLSGLVSRLRKKLRNQDRKFKQKMNKKITKLFESSLGIKPKQEDKDKVESDHTYCDGLINNLIKSIKILKENENAKFEDEKNLIENLLYIISDNKLSIESIHFKKICTIIRMFIEKEKIKYISEDGKAITYSFKEKDIIVTPQEYDYYLPFKNNEEALRNIFGLSMINKDYPNIINFSNNFPFNNNNNINNINNNISNNSTLPNLFKNINPNPLLNNNPYIPVQEGFNPSNNNNDNVWNYLISMYSGGQQVSQISQIPQSSNISAQNDYNDNINKLLNNKKTR